MRSKSDGGTAHDGKAKDDVVKMLVTTSVGISEASNNQFDRWQWPGPKPSQ
jgi:hypothetical protein